MKDSDDHTLFAWSANGEKTEPGLTCSTPASDIGLLADSPYSFRFSAEIRFFRRWDVSDPYSMTNKGLKIVLPVRESSDRWLARLDCDYINEDQRYALAIPLKQFIPDGDQYSRLSGPMTSIPLRISEEAEIDRKKDIYIRKEMIKPEDVFRTTRRRDGFRLLPVLSTRSLLKSYGSLESGPEAETLRAPAETSYKWIEPQAWMNWHVVCQYTPKWTRKVNAPGFVVFLGYNPETERPWCTVELYDAAISLHDVWSRVAKGTFQQNQDQETHEPFSRDETFVPE